MCTRSSGIILLEPEHNKENVHSVYSLFWHRFVGARTHWHTKTHTVRTHSSEIKKHTVCTRSVSGVIFVGGIKISHAIACTFWIQVYQQDYVDSSGFHIGQLSYLLSCWHYSRGLRVGIYDVSKICISPHELILHKDFWQWYTLTYSSHRLTVMHINIFILQRLIMMHINLFIPQRLTAMHINLFIPQRLTVMHINLFIPQINSDAH